MTLFIIIIEYLHLVLHGVSNCMFHSWIYLATNKSPTVRMTLLTLFVQHNIIIHALQCVWPPCLHITQLQLVHWCTPTDAQFTNSYYNIIICSVSDCNMTAMHGTIVYESWTAERGREREWEMKTLSMLPLCTGHGASHLLLICITDVHVIIYWIHCSGKRAKAYIQNIVYYNISTSTYMQFVWLVVYHLRQDWNVLASYTLAMRCFAYQ